MAWETNRDGVCVVDDNVDAADSLSMLLQAMGYEAHTANDGESGLALILRVQPFAAILDIGMPRMSGYDLAKAVRSVAGAAIRLIAVTGWGQAHDVQRARDAGFDHHFTKPAAPAELLALLAGYHEVHPQAAG